MKERTVCINGNVNVDKVKEFLEYFYDLDKIGAPYSFNDMCEKAEKMMLPHPHRDSEGNLYW